MFDNSDDYGFTPSENSKLASLFGITPAKEEVPNPSLKYKPPKQPTSRKDLVSKSPDNPGNNPSTSVVLAKVVTLWKLENNNYNPLGTHGLAIIGSKDLNKYEIIGYKEKNNVILRGKINENFHFYIRKDNYSSFYDNDSRNWLAKFQNGGDQEEFQLEMVKLEAKVIAEDAKQEKKSSEKPQITPSTAQKPELSPKPEPSTTKPDNSDSSDTQKKANILNRMARMGQPILPRTPSSDSESEELRPSQRRLKPKIKSQQETYSLVPSAFQPPQVDQTMAQFLMLQNNELRMSLAQISAKLDGIGGGDQSKDQAMLSKVKALKLKLDNLEQALSKSEMERSDLKTKYKHLLESSENQQDLQRKIEHLQRELSLSKARIKDLEESSKSCVDEANIKINEQNETIQTQQSRIEELESLSETYKTEKDQISSTVNMLNNTIENMKLKLNDFEVFNERARFEKEHVDQEKREQLNRMAEVVKKHMNEMYQLVISSFDEDETYDIKEIQGIIAKNLKGTTFKVIEGCVDLLKDKQIDFEKL